jgi:hypothetical protein
MPTAKVLSSKQRVFVDAYDGDAKAAAIAAGYLNPAVIGSQNLKSPRLSMLSVNVMTKYR